VLACCWNESGNRVFSAGGDNKAIFWDLATNSKSVVAEHDAPIKTVN